MHVTLRQLQVFKVVAKQLSYTKAAQQLHLSQPAVSMQIKQLEDQVGLALFEKLGKRIYLTEAGREMSQTCAVITQQLIEAETVIEDLKGVKRGHLKVAVASTANYFAAQLLAIFSGRTKEISISLDVTNREGLLGQLESNETDLVIMGRPPKGLDLVAESFMDNPLVVIAAFDHGLNRHKKIFLSELQTETFVVREQGSGTRIAMERFFAEQKIELTTGMEMSSNEAIKQAVHAGLGLGIVSIHTLELELDSKRLAVLDVEKFPIMRQWYIVHRKGKRLSPVADAFKKFILDEATQLWKIPI